MQDSLPKSLQVHIPNKTFYMIRHGESVANAERFAAGMVDTPLTDKGREQARLLKSYLEHERLSAKILVHSHLSRARETAEIVNEALRLPTKENQDIAEYDFGEWVGQSWDILHHWIEEGRRPENGETVAEFTSRVLRGLVDILAVETTPVIVSHGGVFEVLAWAFSCDLGHIKNCCLYEFVPTGKKEGFPWDVRAHGRHEGDKVGTIPVIPTAWGAKRAFWGG